MNEPDHHRISRIVGNRIRLIRRQTGVSQFDLSEMAQINITSLSRIERGTTNPKLDMLARLATALDTSVADLVQDITPDDVFPKQRTRITATDLINARRAAGEPEA